MLRCCFRPIADEDVLAAVAVSSHSQPRSHVVPTLADSRLRPPTPHFRVLKGTPSHRNSGPGGGGSSLHGGVKRGQVSGGSASAWLSAPAGKVSYKGTDQDRLIGKGRFLSLLSRVGSGGSADLLSRTEPSTQRRSRQSKLAAAAATGGSGGGSDDGDDDDQDDGGVTSGQGLGGSLQGSTSTVVAQLKTAQPKRSILKKADTPLDAAAAGDEEALMRLALSLASNSAITNAASAASAAMSMPVTTAAITTARDNLTADGSFCTGTSGDSVPLTSAAVGTVLLPRNSSATSPVDITMLYKGGQNGSRRSSANAWMDVATAADATGATINGSGSGSFVQASSGAGGGNPPSRLANSSTAMAALGGEADAIGFPAHIVSLQYALGRSLGHRPESPSSGWISGPSVLYPRDSGTLQPTVAADFARTLDGSSSAAAAATDAATGTTLTRVTFASVTRQPTPPHAGRKRRMLSDIPTSYIAPVSPAQPPPARLVSDTCRSCRSTPGGAVPPPRSPGNDGVQDGTAASPFVRTQPFNESSSVPSSGGTGNGGDGTDRSQGKGGGGSSSRRGVQLTAATREEILRSLPQGKSPVWYAHKLREILGTAEADDEGGGAGGKGDHAEGPAERSLDSSSSLRCSSEDRSRRFSNSGAGGGGVVNGSNAEGNGGHRVSYSRFRGEAATGDGGSITRGASSDVGVGGIGGIGFCGDAAQVPPAAQRTVSRVMSPPGQQQQQQQLAASVGPIAGIAAYSTIGGGGVPVILRRGPPPRDAWTVGLQPNLPGSLPVQDAGSADDSFGSRVNGTMPAASATLLGIRRRLADEHSGSSVSVNGGGAAASAAAAAAILERLRHGDSLHGGFGAGAGSGSAKSEPLINAQKLKPYGSLGRLYDAATAHRELSWQSSARQFGMERPQLLTMGARSSCSFSTAITTPPLPQVMTALDPPDLSPMTSPVVVLETASKKLSDLMSSLGTTGGIIHEEEEDNS